MENIKTAYNVNDEIIYNDFIIKITDFYINPIEIGKNKDEVILYIYINYPNDQTIYSSNLYLNTLNKHKINYYSVDGLDYLGGVNRREEPFIRFSVPKNILEYILYIDEGIRIYIKLED
ncbi:MAG: hypothetical protein WC907_06740 [Acholeplasmataceae bacterium]